MIDKRRHPSGAGRRRRQTTQGIARPLSVGGCGKLSAPGQPIGPRSPNQCLACLDACAEAAPGRSRGTRHPCCRGACQCSIGDSGIRSCP